MPFVLAFFGVLLIVAGFRGRAKELFHQMADDGQHFIAWFFIVLIVASVGLSKTWRPVSNAFFVLVIIALFLRSSNNIITQFKSLTSESAS